MCCWPSLVTYVAGLPCAESPTYSVIHPFVDVQYLWWIELSKARNTICCWPLATYVAGLPCAESPRYSVIHPVADVQYLWWIELSKARNTICCWPSLVTYVVGLP